MANFIQIQDGVFVDTAAIEGIRKPDELNKNTVIFTHHRKYSSPLAFETILAMIRQEESVDRKVADSDKINSTMAKLDKVLNNSQHFAG